MILSSGSTLGPYEIVETLGQGGMATVYKAYEHELQRHVALKVLPVEFLRDPAFGERFQREARVVARLEHPNIVPIFAYGIEEHQGIPWMAMRLIAGGHVGDRIGDNRLNVTETVALIAQVADALDYAHAQGVIHRDIKPQNILLDIRGRVYLADFGIARISESSGALTGSGVITGTPQYMAPEQATGEPVDHRSDVYSLGVVAYKMLAGRAPFDAPTPVALLMKHAREPVPVPPIEVVPQALAQPLLKALEKRPKNRWQTAGEFARALQAGHAELTSPPVRRPSLVRAPGDPTTRSLSLTISGVARRPAFWAASAFVVSGLGAMTLVAPVAIWFGASLWGSPWPPVPTPTPVPTPQAVAPPGDEASTAGVFDQPEPDPPEAAAPPPPVSHPRAAGAPATRAAPPATRPAAAPAPAVRVAVTLRIDAAQDPRNPDAVPSLQLQLRVAGQELSPVQIEFGSGSTLARSRTRGETELFGVPGGRQPVEAIVMPDTARGRAGAEATAQLELREGTRIPLEIRERLDGSWEIRFR
jgi:serine/threonine-protein kinase